MMSTETRSDMDTFQSCLWNIYGSCDPASALAKIRAKAWDQFLSKGLPTKDNDVFKYIRLRNLYSQKFIGPTTYETSEALPILPECRGAVLVMINGAFSPTLSQMENISKRAVILPIHEALETYSAFLNSQWTRTLKDENDPFALLNLSLQQEGIFLYLPPKTVIENPIQILHIIDVKNSKDAATIVHPRVQVFVGSQSEMTLVNTWHHVSGEGYAINAVTDIAIEDNAHVKVIQNAVDFPADTWQFDAMRVLLKKQSTFKSIAATNGAETVRQDYRVTLAGEGAEASLNGVWMLNDKREAHAHILMDHQAPHCRSMQLFKSALDDNSRSSFEGKIYIHQLAQKTEAFQMNNNLLLSDNAHADSKPNLEIFADDVKASHGATIGQLDKDQIFYMKTRGFNEQQATQMLVHSFCKEVIDMVMVDSLRERLEQVSSTLSKEDGR